MNSNCNNFSSKERKGGSYIESNIISFPTSREIAEEQWKKGGMVCADYRPLLWRDKGPKELKEVPCEEILQYRGISWPRFIKVADAMKKLGYTAKAAEMQQYAATHNGIKPTLYERAITVLAAAGIDYSAADEELKNLLNKRY